MKTFKEIFLDEASDNDTGLKDLLHKSEDFPYISKLTISKNKVKIIFDLTGYKQIFSYIKNKKTLDTMKEDVVSLFLSTWDKMFKDEKKSKIVVNKLKPDKGGGSFYFYKDSVIEVTVETTLDNLNIEGIEKFMNASPSLDMSKALNFPAEAQLKKYIEDVIKYKNISITYEIKKSWNGSHSYFEIDTGNSNSSDVSELFSVLKIKYLSTCMVDIKNKVITLTNRK
jgi:hypothetical protein